MEIKNENTPILISRVREKRIKIKPLTLGWMGASIVLLIVVLSLFIFQMHYLLWDRGFIDFTVGTFLFIAAVVLVSGVITLLLHGMKKVPSRYLWLFFSSIVLLFICFVGPLTVSITIVLSMIIGVSIWGALFYLFIKGSFKGWTKLKKNIASGLFVTISIALGLIGYWLIQDGNAGVAGVTIQELKTNSRYDNHSLKSPLEKGPYQVQTITYGSQNSYRKEFNQPNSLITETVDGSASVEKWSSLRTKTVGFGPEAMPLNGTVWYPEGSGPFPLVVMVHGNHKMTNYSDPGYDYLGELLASRGYIFVSLDENYLNSSPYDDMFVINPLVKENPARGFIILEHLRKWKEWNLDKDTPFYQKVNMDQIALIGHSRGGEGIAIAAAFNKLSHSPDNGNIKFDYHFNIRSLISIAGTDGQYKSSGKPVSLENVNFLALHGAHDMDVSTFDSASQYHRISYTNEEDFISSAVYVYGANHGQFNRRWNRGDGLGVGNQLFNLNQIMSRDDQEKLAKVFISAFLDATLRNDNDYKDIFKDIGYAKEWLPETMYISNYKDSKTNFISTYAEDIDLQSTTIPGGKLDGKNLQEWKEEKVKMKYGDSEVNAVKLGWDRSKNSETAAYSVVLPPESINITENSAIVFSIADSSERNSAPTLENLVDLTVKVEDEKGNKASLPLSHISKLVPMVEGKLLKWPFASLGETKEPIFQHYSFELTEFKQVNNQFNPMELKKISFEFDLIEAGTVLMNDIGIRNES